MLRSLIAGAAALVESFLPPSGGIWLRAPPTREEITRLENRRKKEQERQAGNRSGASLDPKTIGRQASRQTVRREERELEKAMAARRRREAKAERKKNRPRNLTGALPRPKVSPRQGWCNRARTR